MGGLYGTDLLIRLSLSTIYEYKKNQSNTESVGLETESVNKPNDERTKNKVIYRLTKYNRKRKQDKRTQNPLVWRPKALTNQTTNERRIRLSTD